MSLMLGAVHSEPILAQLAADGPERFTAAMRRPGLRGPGPPVG
jgi:hypothetical protein